MFIEDRRTRVKICGITTLEDGRFASGAQADYLGFIFWPGSKRYITPERATEIIGWIEGPECVGVFVDQTIEEVNRIAIEAGIDLVQLHGEESVEYCQQMVKPVIKSFRIKPEMTGNDIENLVSPYLDHVSYILFDSYDKIFHGGTGKTFNWNLLEKIRMKVPVILAGGISAENVVQAINSVKPFMVDVSSSLENEPGIKDFDKITEFFEQMDAINEL
ncbi:MAG: phosphoribosylanthranilate isomerase [Balneolales bacterium]